MNFEPNLRQLHLCANVSNAVMNELVESEALKRHNDLFYMKKYCRFSGGFLSDISSTVSYTHLTLPTNREV